MLRDVAFEGVGDVEDGVGADLEAEETGLEGEECAVGLLFDGGDGIEGHPLGAERVRGCECEENREEEGDEVPIRMKNGNRAHEIVELRVR